jgi:hypothetical protein
LFVWFSCFGFSFRFGELFHFTFFFLCFGFAVFASGNPNTQTVSPFLPESLEAVAKKVTEITTLCVSHRDVST